MLNFLGTNRSTQRPPRLWTPTDYIIRQVHIETIQTVDNYRIYYYIGPHRCHPDCGQLKIILLDRSTQRPPRLWTSTDYNIIRQVHIETTQTVDIYRLKYYKLTKEIFYSKFYKILKFSNKNCCPSGLLVIAFLQKMFKN